ncbi:uncharacterized protein LOC134763284 [Penaeus indicus]|uniref:uncharacterized protein LOC134763284 n=1 Tax=Penaeus indicus TaxID=29960 RepID=UPI00300C8181
MSSGRGIEPTSVQGRYAYITTDASGSSVWRLPLATTNNDLGIVEGSLIYGGLGAGTALTLLTMAHAVFFGKRRKRDLRSVLEDNLDDPTLAADFEKIYASDSNWCGLRLTCELAAKAGAPLTEEEKMMLSFFRGMVSAEDLQEMDTPQLYYSYASFVGFSQGDPEKCQQMYSKCPYSAKKMMQVYRTAHFRSVEKRRDQLQPSYTLG